MNMLKRINTFSKSCSFTSNLKFSELFSGSNQFSCWDMWDRYSTWGYDSLSVCWNLNLAWSERNS